MTPLELVCGALALTTAGLLIACAILVSRVLEWRRRYDELVDKPIDFWLQRHAMQRALLHPHVFDMRPGAEVVELHQPWPPAA